MTQSTHLSTTYQQASRGDSLDVREGHLETDEAVDPSGKWTPFSSYQGSSTEKTDRVASCRAPLIRSVSRTLRQSADTLIPSFRARFQPFIASTVQLQRIT